MATNADTTVDETVVADDDSAENGDDLRSLKYDDNGVETTQVADEPLESDEEPDTTDDTAIGEDDGQTDDGTEEDEEQSNSFVKEFPNIKGDTPEEYARNLEIAYQNSTKEALRLKGLTESKDDDGGTDTPIASDTLNIWAKQQLDDEIQTAYSSFLKEYPQASPGTPDYEAFTKKVAILSQTILSSEGRLASPSELYATAAVLLGWERQAEPDNKERLGMAVKDTAASSKTTSATKKTSKSKVTDAMIQANRRMYPDKSDAEIRTELEPYV